MEAKQLPLGGFEPLIPSRSYVIPDHAVSDKMPKVVLRRVLSISTDWRRSDPTDGQIQRIEQMSAALGLKKPLISNSGEASDKITELSARLKNLRSIRKNGRRA